MHPPSVAAQFNHARACSNNRRLNRKLFRDPFMQIVAVDACDCLMRPKQVSEIRAAEQRAGCLLHCMCKPGLNQFDDVRKELRRKNLASLCSDERSECA